MSRLNRETLFNIPNLMTMGRVAVIPVIMVLMILQSPTHSMEFNRVLSYSSAGLFILAGISDLVDGYYARKYGMVSIFGQFLDPLADKLVHMAVMILLIPMGRFPAWLVVLLLFREIIITGLRAVAASDGVVISAGEGGKKKTAWLTCGLSGLLLYYPLYGISTYTVGWFCIVVGSAYSLISGVKYIKDFFQEVDRE